MKRHQERSHKAPRSDPTPTHHTRWYRGLILPAILLITVLVFSNSLKNGFVSSWDDDQYVLENALIKDLSWDNIQKVFASFHSSGNYHPLTLLTLAIEYDRFGLDPKPYHVTNLLLHCLNTLLVFHLVRLLTSRDEVSAISALFFGIHPMHVESVAWISERKDVLFAAFYLGSLISYVTYIRKKGFRTGAGKKSKESTPRTFYGVALGLFTLSLLSKSAAVSLPIILILIDYYSGERLDRRNLAEKVPFFVISIIFGVIALFSQQSVGAISTASLTYPTFDRILFACYSVNFYLFKLFFPLNLSAFYPFPVKTNGWFPTEYYVGPIILVAIIVIIYLSNRFRKDLVFGGLFYLANIGLVLQVVGVGSAIVAERYAYLSYIGLFFIIGQVYCRYTDQMSVENPTLRWLLIGLVIAYSGFICVLTFKRIPLWSDTTTLLSDAIDKDPRSGLAYLCRGIERRKQNHNGGALSDFNSAIQAYPGFTEAYAERGNMRVKRGEYEEAIADFNFIIRTNPKYRQLNKVYYNRATARENAKDYQGAIADYTSSLESGPPDISMYIYFSRGRVYSLLGQRSESCGDWSEAAKLGHPKAMEMLKQFCR